MDAITPTQPDGPLVIIKDFVCPLCYFSLGEWGLLEKQPENRRTVAALLLPNLPAGGLVMAEYDRRRGMPAETRARNNAWLASEAERVGLPWVTREKLCYTMPAHVFAKWAVAEGVDPLKVDLEVFRAYYGRGEDIETTKALEGVAIELGLPAGKVAAALADPVFVGAVAHDMAVQKAVAFLNQVVINHGTADVLQAEQADRSTSDRERVLSDWRDEKPDNMDWSHLRTLTVPATHDRAAVSDAVTIIDQWGGRTSPWTAKSPSGQKFYQFVSSGPIRRV